MNNVHHLHSLAALTWQEAADLLKQRPIGILPIGAIEAHGPHLPLGTDVIIATAIAERAAALLTEEGLPVLVLPPLPYGASFIAACFPGTSPAEPDAFRAYLTSVLLNLLPQGYRCVCICNAHREPAHAEAVWASARAAAAATGVPVVFPDVRDYRWASVLGDEFRSRPRHAGRAETSIMLAAQPGAVRHDGMAHLPEVPIDLPARLREGARTLSEAGGTLGYFGDPARANAAEGERLLASLAGIVRAAVLEALAGHREPVRGSRRSV